VLPRQGMGGTAVKRADGICFTTKSSDDLDVVCCQVEVSATDRSLFQMSPGDCGVTECDREASKMRPRPTRAVETWEGITYLERLVSKQRFNRKRMSIITK
jgi:hypothetical protein